MILRQVGRQLGDDVVHTDAHLDALANLDEGQPCRPLQERLGQARFLLVGGEHLEHGRARFDECLLAEALHRLGKQCKLIVI